jgi:hypothetical protein
VHATCNFLQGLTWSVTLLLSASRIAVMSGVYHHAQLLVEMGVLQTFLHRLALNHDPPNLSLGL